MKTEEIRNLLQRYFDAETTADDEKLLTAYFNSGKVDQEFASCIPYFAGISEMSEASCNSAFENDVMNYILAQEQVEKSKYRRLRMAVTGIAASLLIIIPGYFIYVNQHKPFGDTFSNPSQASAYAEQTLRYVSSKYNKGLVQLTKFGKIEKASLPLKKGMKPLGDFINGIEKMKNEERIKEINN